MMDKSIQNERNATITKSISFSIPFNPIALRQAKIVYNFGLSECNGVKNGECERMNQDLLSI